MNTVFCVYIFDIKESSPWVSFLVFVMYPQKQTDLNGTAVPLYCAISTQGHPFDVFSNMSGDSCSNVRQRRRRLLRSNAPFTGKAAGGDQRAPPLWHHGCFFPPFLSWFILGQELRLLIFPRCSACFDLHHCFHLLQVNKKKHSESPFLINIVKQHKDSSLWT